jgi:magnesium-transporting ATPase (P-type)
MDTLAALAFGGEPILDRYMDESPAKRTDNILTKYIKSAIGVSAAYITCVSIFVLENIGGILNIVRPVTTGIISDVMNDIAVYDFDVYDKTFMFACFIYAIIFNSLNTRSETWNLFEHIGENKRFIIVMGGIFIMQTALLQFGGAVFETTPLTLKGYLFAILLGAMIIPVDMIRKAVVNKISHS